MRLPLRINLKKIKFVRGLNLNLKIEKDINIKISVSNNGENGIFTLGYNNLKFKEVYGVKFKISKENELVNFDSEINNYINLESLEKEDFDIFSDVIKKLDYFKNEFKKILYNLSDLSVFRDCEKKYVWLDIMDGFSNSWEGQEETEEMLVDLDKDEISNAKNWKLIEYICHTDKEFEFNNNMKLK